MTSSHTEALLEEIRVHAARKRITQAAMAKHINQSTSAFSRRMQGEQPFTVDDIYRLADLFGVPTSALLPADTAEVSA